jgi:hypothetical protein
MKITKKRRHHYVWRKYLRAWSNKEKIFCLREGKIFNPNLMGVGQERDFYKLKKLSCDEIQFIRQLAIENSPKESIDNHESLLKNFTFLHQLYEKNPQLANTKDPEVINYYEALLHNLEEELHSSIENTGQKYLDLLLAEDTSFFETDEGFMDFIYYLSAQYMRTKKIRESIKLSFSQKGHAKTIENTWNILSHIFATNMGGSLYCQRKDFKLILIKNISDHEFITGDQPVINVFSCSTPEGQAPDRLAFYYPISPLLSVLIIEKKYFIGKALLEYGNKEVLSHNDAMRQQAFEQIYASKKSSLEFICET